MFFLSAFASLKDPRSRANHDKKRAEGNRHNQTLSAMARRRCDVLFAMHCDGTLYDAPGTERKHHLHRPAHQRGSGQDPTTRARKRRTITKHQFALAQEGCIDEGDSYSFILTKSPGFDDQHLWDYLTGNPTNIAVHNNLAQLLDSESTHRFITDFIREGHHNR